MLNIGIVTKAQHFSDNNGDIESSAEFWRLLHAASAILAMPECRLSAVLRLDVAGGVGRSITLSPLLASLLVLRIFSAFIDSF